MSRVRCYSVVFNTKTIISNLVYCYSSYSILINIIAATLLQQARRIYISYSTI